GRAREARWLRRRGAARRQRLSDRSVPARWIQRENRPIRGFAGESNALPPRGGGSGDLGVRRGSRRGAALATRLEFRDARQQPRGDLPLRGGGAAAVRSRVSARDRDER